MKIPFNKLEIGMMTTEGLIVRTGEANSDRFHGDNAFIYTFDLNDSYYGMVSRTVKENEEFEILHEPGTEEYRKIIQELINERVDAMFAAQQDVDLLRAYMKLKP